MVDGDFGNELGCIEHLLELFVSKPQSNVPQRYASEGWGEPIYDVKHMCKKNFSQ